MSRARLAIVALVAAGCAEAPPPPPPAPSKRPAPIAAPAPDADAPDRPPEPARIRPAEPDDTMETKHLTEKQWIAEVRTKLGAQLKVDPAELRLSNDRQWAVIVRGPPPPPPGKKGKQPPRRRPPQFQIVVTGVDGKRPQIFRPVTLKGSDEPPKDVHFLADDRVVYEVAQPPPPATPPKKPAKRPKPAPKTATKLHTPPRPVVPDPHLPERLFVIQPIGKRARPVRCAGTRFSFTTQQDHLAFAGGPFDAGFVSVDGAQVYPRKGRTVIATDPAWSKDGHSLAFLELRPPAPARLVLLAEFDNPSGDTTWDLPASAALDGAHVFWAGLGKLVVGRTSMRPIFAASFYKEKPAPAWREP